MVEKILPESISKGLKNQKVLRSSQPGFLKGKLTTVYETNPEMLNLSISFRMEKSAPSASLQSTQK